MYIPFDVDVYTFCGRGVDRMKLGIWLLLEKEYISVLQRGTLLLVRGGVSGAISSRCVRFAKWH